MKTTEATILRNLAAMRESQVLDGLAYWGTMLRNALVSRGRYRPGSIEGLHARRYVRHCVKQIRILEAQ